MMDQESELPFSLKDARYIAGGVKILKAKIQSPSYSTERAGVLTAVNAQKIVRKKPYH
jgi:hypothetical protein